MKSSRLILIHNSEQEKMIGRICETKKIYKNTIGL